MPLQSILRRRAGDLDTCPVTKKTSDYTIYDAWRNAAIRHYSTITLNEIRGLKNIEHITDWMNSCASDTILIINRDKIVKILDKYNNCPVTRTKKLRELVQDDDAVAVFFEKQNTYKQIQLLAHSRKNRLLKSLNENNFLKSHKLLLTFFEIYHEMKHDNLLFLSRKCNTFN
jgi:hypothetical protein